MGALVKNMYSPGMGTGCNILDPMYLMYVV